ncbi:MAG: hypothetical protein Q9170_002531 [Blastenia crenularia]
MDFWSRLVSGASTNADKKQTNLNSPQQRLASFKRAYLQLQQIWQKASLRPSNSPIGSTPAPHLQTLNQILQDETRTTTAHVCIQYVASSQAYSIVTSVGSASINEQITKEAARFLNLLIDSEEVDFTENVSFADQLMNFIHTISSTGSVSPNTNNEMAQLLFAVSAKLRQKGTVPSAWFRLSTSRKHGSSFNQDLPTAKSQEFPIIYELLEYVYREGKSGDFARTGLLYVLELSARSDILERWIVESELATMMASGLGALYSQLSSKVNLSYTAESLPPILAFSNMTDVKVPSDAEPISSATLQANLATFLSFLAFWQDVLERCQSRDIKATLLDHFEFLFLRPLLYPSLVESSDIDSGSSVAVMTYLRCILEGLSHPDITGLILRYMLGAAAQSVEVSKPSRPSTLAQRRKSQTLISNNAIRIDDPSPDLITLTNILLGYLKSQNQQTVTASLRLLGTILRSWHGLSNTTIMKVSSPMTLSLKRLRSLHDQQLEAFYILAEEISADDNALEEHFESQLEDAQVLVEMHPCSADWLLPSSDTLEKIIARDPLLQRTIVHDDPLLDCLLSLLEDFLVNDIVVNLSLSETLAALASCGMTSLDGWLLPSVSDDTHRTSYDERETRVDPSTEKVSASDNSSGMSSAVVARLELLVQRIDSLRQDIHNFDVHLAERRQTLKVGKDVDDAVANVSNLTSKPLKEGSQSRSKSQPHIGSISEMLKTPSTSSRSTSPRGRQQEDTSDRAAPPKSLAGRLSHLRMSPSPSRSNPLDRTYSPSPLRKQSFSSTSSSPKTSPKEPLDALQRKVRLQVRSRHRRFQRDGSGSETSSLRSESLVTESDIAEETREVSLSHLLTNVLILQEFILELAAIIQVRASLFGEVNP